MSRPIPEPAEVIRNLREKVLTLAPELVGMAPSEKNPRVWGAVMESGYPEGLVTLVVLADGTTSLYFGGGGGIIGAGTDEAVREASDAFLQEAERHHGLHRPAADFPLPEVDMVNFYLLTFTGPLSAGASEFDLGERRHPLSSLFYAGHEVIGRLRQVSEGFDNSP